MTEKTGNVLFVRPVGWQRKDNPDSSIVLTPPDLPPGRECELHIFSGGERGASLRESFDAGWQSLLNDLNAKVASGGEAHTSQKDGYDAISTTAVLKTATGASIYATFFVAAPGTRVEAVLFLADSEETYNKHVGAMNTFVGTVRFSNLQPRQATVVAGVSTPTPTVVAAIAASTSTPQAPATGLIDSMYRSIQIRLNPLGRPGETRIYVEYLVFFTNGNVYRGQAEGGPTTADPVRERELFGTYKVVGDQVRITWWFDGRSAVFQRVADRLEEQAPYHYANREVYVLLPKVDGLRLQETYVQKRDPSMLTLRDRWISFALDGTFREEGILDMVLLNLSREPLPPRGSGTYAIKDYTLELRYTGGYTRRIGFFVVGDTKRPMQVFLNTYALDLQQ